MCECPRTDLITINLVLCKNTFLQVWLITSFGWMETVTVFKLYQSIKICLGILWNLDINLLQREAV